MENIIKDNEGKTWINIDYFIEQYNSNRKTLVMPNVSIMNIDKKKLIEKFTKITDIEKVLIFVQPEEIKRIIESYIDTFREKKTPYYIADIVIFSLIAISMTDCSLISRISIAYVIRSKISIIKSNTTSRF